MLEYLPTKTDLEAGLRWLAGEVGETRSRRRRLRRLVTMAAVTVGLIGGFIFSATVLHRVERAQASMVAIAGGVLLGLMAWTISAPWSRWRQDRELLRDVHGYPWGNAPLQVGLEATGLVVTSLDTELHHSWSPSDRAGLTDTHAVVFAGRNLLSIPVLSDPPAVAWFGESAKAGVRAATRDAHAEARSGEASTDRYPSPPDPPLLSSLEFELTPLEMRTIGLWASGENGRLAVEVRTARRRRLSMAVVMSLPIIGVVGLRVATGRLDAALLWLVLGGLAVALVATWRNAPEVVRRSSLAPSALERLVPREVRVWFRVSLTPDGVLSQNTTGWSRHAWSTVTSIAETADLFLFRTVSLNDAQAEVAHGIPKRIGAEAVAAFATALRARGAP